VCFGEIKNSTVLPVRSKAVCARQLKVIASLPLLGGGDIVSQLKLIICLLGIPYDLPPAQQTLFMGLGHQACHLAGEGNPAGLAAELCVKKQ
jgi:hypothetical protein